MGELFSFSDTSWLTSSDGQHKLLFDLTANNTHLDLLEANSIRCLTGAPLTERLRITAEGNVGIGTASIYNPQGWHRVVDVVGTSHARLNVRSSGGVVAGVFSHDDWVGPRAVIGTESNHPLTLATNYTHRLTISPDGNVGIGTTVPAVSGLHIGLGVSGGQARIQLDNFNGTVGQISRWTNRLEILSSEAISFATEGLANNRLWVAKDGIRGAVPFYGTFLSTSDAREKTNIAPLVGALDKLKNVRGIEFTWAESTQLLGGVAGQQSIGVIAQEIEEVFPSLVSPYGDQGYKAVNYAGLMGVLIEAVKELKAATEVLGARMEGLERAGQS